MRVPASVAVIAFALIFGAASGCSSPDSDGSAGPNGTTPDSPSSQARPTLTASKLQPPAQDSRFADPSRHDVVVDPCTWIDDSTIQSAGFEPGTRKRGNDIVAEYTFLVCQFNSSTRLLTIESGNVSLDEVRQKYTGQTRETKVNDREALITSKSGDTCSVDMRTDVGYLGIAFLLTNQGKESLKPCDGIVEAANKIEPSIGKGN
ncbi:DUF3558 domain-containing protein [Nocardia sp. NPDC050793]|uniref:DUF3558 domain-containing protein n=1 Tax=Nocardia sp. NPDC050793 TaxID=3155159 RepID=UPI0033FBD864